MVARRADDALLRVGDELLDSCANDAGLLLQVLADRAHLALEAPPVLLDGALDAAATLAQLALELGARLADLALEAVAGGRAAALVALDLALEAGARAVLGGEALDGRDEVVAREQARADRNQRSALGDHLDLRDGRLGLGRGRLVAAGLRAAVVVLRAAGLRRVCVLRVVLVGLLPPVSVLLVAIFRSREDCGHYF